MADALPTLAGPLRSIADRLVDLLPVVRNHVDHQECAGSFGLKSVLPAMVPELRPDTLAIGDGETASLELERLLFREVELTPEAKAQLRGDLVRSCQSVGNIRTLRGGRPALGPHLRDIRRHTQTPAAPGADGTAQPSSNAPCGRHRHGRDHPNRLHNR
jgi:hypothetical protein